MTDFDSFDRRLATALRLDADRVIATFDPASIARAAIQLDHTNQRRALRFPRRIATMNMPTRLAAAAVIAVLAVGGAFYLLRPSQPSVGTPSSTPSASSSPIESVIPSASATAASWTATGSMATPLEGGTATLLHDGRVLVMHAGGDAELYDPTTGSWTSTGTTLGGRWGVTLIDGRVLVAGGWNGNGSFAAAELYDPATGTWTATGSMVAHQNGAETVTLLLDGRVLAAGGLGAYDAKTGREDPVASAELYDPASGTWTATGSMVTPREDHMATLLPDGRVLVAGGYSERSDGSSRYLLAAAELYDPATGTWTATGAMSRPHWRGGTAALLRDGSVLVAEFDPAAPPCRAARCTLVFVAELYDPVTGTWTATESTATPRYFGYTATLLPDGMLLVAGGADAGNQIYGLLASAELYDPGAGSWTATATMKVARAAHTATLLPDGRVLVVGGDGGGTSAELYDPGTGIR